MPDFIPGIELARQFFIEAVKPILDRDFPLLCYDAALIGSGSDVLGFDTPMSRDHFWGPRLYLFVTPEDREAHGDDIREALSHMLPYSFKGYSTHYVYKPDEPHIPIPQSISSGPVQHLVEVHTLRDWVQGYTGIDLSQPLNTVDWLTVSSQKLRTLTAGGVYHSGLGEVEAMRGRLAWYPHEVWLYLLACGWQRISQEEPFVGRTGDVGDDFGSRILAARLVRDVMRLCFLMERQYPPYPKWFGTAFTRLACAEGFTPLFGRVFAANDWREREAALAESYQLAAEMHNRLGVTPPLSTQITTFFNRPYRVIFAGRVVDALMEVIEDETLRGTTIGSIDQWSDSTDVLENAAVTARARNLYPLHLLDNPPD
jgi:hypothetical protein